MHSDPILFTGVAGYVGKRLITEFDEGGYRVRAMGRSFEKIAGKSWSNHLYPYTN